jgi:hypothetical protein
MHKGPEAVYVVADTVVFVVVYSQAVPLWSAFETIA